MTDPQITRLTADLRHSSGIDGEIELSNRMVFKIEGDFDDVLTDQIVGSALFNLSPLPCVAVNAPRGTYDIERASLALRIIETIRGLQDGTIPLIAFLYPHLSALADRAFELHRTPRLVAFALDEHVLHSFGSTSASREVPAAVIVARARLVANARQIGVPALLFLEKADADIQMRAERDGFNGILIEQSARSKSEPGDDVR